MENSQQKLIGEQTHRYLLHYVGTGLYKKEDFVKEAGKIGVNRAFPSFIIKKLKWGDKILLAQYKPNEDKNEKGKAIVFGYFVIHGLNFDCENKEEFIKKLVSQIKVVSGGNIEPKVIKRNCGSYILGAVYYVDEALESIIEKAVKISEEMGIKIKSFANGSFYSIENKEIFPISFTRSGIFVELDKKIESKEIKDKQIGFLGDYEQRKYFTKKEKEEEQDEKNN